MHKTKGHAGFLKRLCLALCALMLPWGGPLLPARANSTAVPVKVGFFAMDGYHIMSENGVRSGYGYEFIHMLAQYSNMQFQYVGYDSSWSEMLDMLLTGEIDLLTSAQKTPEREVQYGFSTTLIGTSAAVLSVKAGDERFAGGNYSGMRIGLVENSSRNAQLNKLMTDKGYAYTSVYYKNMNDITRDLQRGGIIDAAMTSNLRRIENEWILESFESSPYYAITRKDDTELLAQVNAAIERMDMDASGWRTRLLNKYYSVQAKNEIAFSADERDYLNQLVSSGRVLRVTMNPDSAPYSYFENGVAKGIIGDLFAEVAARMGIAYEMIEPANRADYQRLCTNGGVDIILDAMDDVHTAESNGFEITEAYYTSPMAIVTQKSSVNEIKRIAQPSVSLLNESFFASIYDSSATVDSHYASNAEAANDVRSGNADGAYMPYYCAQWLCSADETGQLNCLMLPMFERSFVYAVSVKEDYPLLSSLSKAVGSISEDLLATMVALNTEYIQKNLTFIGFVYQHPILVAMLAALFVALIMLIAYLYNRNKNALLELHRSQELERYIGYLCDIHDKVLEVDFDLKTRKQFMKRNGTVEIAQRNDFTAFDIESIHPDDLAATLTVFSPEAVRALFTSSMDERYIESRMKSETGEYRWYSFLIKLIPVDQNHPCSAMLLIKDIDDLHHERDERNNALHSALEAANAASRAKSTFLSSMSHEIRTPLNAMIGYMTIASSAIDNRDKVLHCVESAGIAARHLLSIINDVLDISSMEAGKLKLAQERFDLKDQLAAISSMFYQQCKTKGIHFTISITGLTDEWVIGDSMRINQVLMNLMSNAVKFTSDGGVQLNVEQTNQTNDQVFICFTVKDTGIGMSETYIQRLFAPFEQESVQTARKYGGTGLGMPITLNLVNLMGGQIDVTSKQGEGTVFTVNIPFTRTENSETHSASHHFSHLHVLVVDDMANECDYIRALLNRCGIHSETAQSGEEAIRLVTIRKNTPEQIDLCIIDWNMPGLNGVQTTQMIHQECDQDIPIIIATAYDISEFEEAAKQAGARRVVSKPLFQSTLLDLLVSVYGKYDAQPQEDEDIPNLSGMHVLLAEDNETNVEVAIDLLELAGVTADVAQNGQEAVDFFRSRGDRYDAILMDVQMPVMDGYAATRAIRASSHERAKTIPIIALTADAFAENVASALAVGMNDHIAKPIETEVLFSVLKKTYSRKK